MFSKQNNRFTKRSKKKARSDTKRNRSRKIAAAFESLEKRELLTTVSWSTFESFNQFTGNKEETAFGFGVTDGPGLGDDAPKFLGFEFDETYSGGTGYKGDEPFRFGVGGKVEAEGRFGIEYGFYANAGTATVENEGSFSYDLISQSDGSFRLDTNLNVTEGQLATISPTISAFADVVLELDASAEGELCFFGCIEGKTGFEDIEARIPLASINRQTNAKKVNEGAEESPVFDGNIKVFGVGIDELTSFKAVGAAAVGAFEEATFNVLTEALTKLSFWEGEELKRRNDLEEAKNRGIKTAQEINDLENSLVAARREVVNFLAEVEEAEKEKNKNDSTEKKDAKDDKNGGGTSAGLGLTVGLSQAENLLGLTGELSVGGSKGVIAGERKLGDLSLTLPEVNLSGEARGDQPVRVSTDNQFFCSPGGEVEFSDEHAELCAEKRKVVDMNLSLGGILLGSYGLGETSITVGPLEASVTPIDYILGTSLSVRQTVDSKISEHTIRASFGTNVTATVNGFTQPIASTIDFAPGANVTFTPENPEDFSDVNFELINTYAVNNNIGLDLDIDGTLKALELVLEAFSLELKLGPVVDWEHSILDENLGSIFDKELTVEGKPWYLGTAKLLPDLTIDLVDSSPYVSSVDDNQFELEFEVKNIGAVAASNVSIAMTGLNSGGGLTGGEFVGEFFDLHPCFVHSGSESVTTDECNIGSLKPGETKTVTLFGASSFDGDLELKSAQVYDTGGQDQDPSNNTAKKEVGSNNVVTIPRIEPETYLVSVDEDQPGDKSQCKDAADQCSLEDVVRLAEVNPGHDVIRFEVGVESLLPKPITITDALTVLGRGSCAVVEGEFGCTRIVADGNSDEEDGHFLIRPANNNPYDMEFLFDSLVLESQDGANGGSITADGFDATLTVENVGFRNNRNEKGGGGAIQAEGSWRLNVRDSYFDGNISNDRGGAIKMTSRALSALLVGDSLFKNNASANGGGAIYAEAGEVEVNGTAFEDNNTPGSGGAIELRGEPFGFNTTSITSSRFLNNTAGANGDGIAFFGDPIVNSGSHFADFRDTVLANNPENGGGNVYVDRTGDRHSISSSGQNLSTDSSTPFFDKDTDRTNRALVVVEGYEDGHIPKIPRGVPGAVVGRLVHRNALLEFTLSDPLFEIDRFNVLKLKEGVELTGNHDEINLNVGFAANHPLAFFQTTTLNFQAMSLPDPPTVFSPKSFDEMDLTGNEKLNIISGGQIVGGRRELTWTGQENTGYLLKVHREGRNDAGDATVDVIVDAIAGRCSATCTLHVDSLPFAEELTFQLTAVNEVGMGEPAMLAVTIVAPPAEIRRPVDASGVSLPFVSNLTTNSITLDWSDVERAESYSASPVLLEARENIVGETVMVPVPIGPVGVLSESTRTFTTLAPDTTYFFQIKAINDSGESSRVIEVTTLPEDVTNFTSPAVVTKLSPSSVQVQWGDVGNEAFYRVVYTATDGGSERSRYFVPDTTTATIGNLEPNTNYDFVVQAGNSVSGSATDTLQIKTDPGLAETTIEVVTTPLDTVLRDNAGVIVTPINGASIISALGVYTAETDGDNASDPTSYKLEGLGRNGYETISEGSLTLPTQRNAPHFPVFDHINATAYLSYRLTFPTLKDETAARMQVGKIELVGELVGPESLPLELNIDHWNEVTLSLGAGFTATDISAPQQTDIGSYDVTTGGGITYEFIVNVPEVAGVSSAFMGSRNGPVGQNVALKFDQWQNLGTYGATAFGVADFDSGVDHTLGADTHVVFVADGSDMHLYVNGEFETTMDGASAVLSGLTGIGHAYDHQSMSGLDPLGGTLRGIAVYDLALDGDAIRSNFTSFTTLGPPTDFPIVDPIVDPTPSDGVSGFVNSDGFIVVEGSGQPVVGLDFLSDGGLLSTVGNASPFGFFLSETPNQVTLGVLGQANAVTLDGTLVTPVKYSGGNPSQDLTAIWGDTSSVLTEFDVTTPANPGVADGLVGFIDSAGFVTLRGSGEKVVGLDLQSPDGRLVPLGTGEAAPFQFTLSNTSEHITLGNLGTSIEINGILKTNVRYTGQADRLIAQWGDTESVQRDIIFSSNSSPCNSPSLNTVSDCADNLAERDEILAQLGLLLGDLDGNGNVGFPDFLKLSDSFGEGNKRYTDGDIDLDGSVGFADFLVLADQFGKAL